MFLQSAALIQPLAAAGAPGALGCFDPIVQRDMCMDDKEHLRVGSPAGVCEYPPISGRGSRWGHIFRKISKPVSDSFSPLLSVLLPVPLPAAGTA